MNKRLGLGFTCVILAATTACGNSKETTASKEQPKSKEGKTVVTVSLKESNPYYEAAAKKFKEKYPDIDVQIQSFKQPGEERVDNEKYIKTTNTALLSGKGADMIEVTGLPVDKYVNQQLLLNMSDMLDLDKTVNKSDLQTNVLDAMKLNGGLYTMPASFFLRAFVGDGDALQKANVKVDDKSWNWKQFEEIARKLVQQTASGKERRFALGNEQPEVILQEWVVDSYGQFIDRATRKAKFDSPAFTDLLRQVKKLYDDKIMTAQPMDNERPLFYSERIFSPADFIKGPYTKLSNPKLLQKPHPEGKTGGVRIITTSELAIQAKSEGKEEAWKFMAFLLSEEVQSSPYEERFSLLKSVNEKKLDELQKQTKGGAYKLEAGKTAKVSEEDFARFKQFLHTADRYADEDVKVLNIIYDEAEAFFSGQKSAEEVAKLIQNRTTTYLNE
ncbi:multiple sugar transport system substrate-binding protein [Paenibacillus tianmuensis]|uniref:Multiple sugar transport system substrate-binding protein n=1 Tax=Paenibacillus tianmuensis TaxID=624147 RepID=A0A1G4S8W5_9BACL|nr:ABC transporter substrate-binding protein [Paenibacillus tianmuensis]SCW65643.1 multiple sugar transport system substrate-binding protein [Paenibacillus tianmuensis]